MQHVKYLRYVVLHKWYVFLECLKYGLLWRGLVHDLSKFSLDEWLPYAYYFYGDEKKKNQEWFMLTAKYGVFEATPYGEHYEDKFNIAWNHHQKRNDHHWQYWLLTEDSGRELVMPMSDAARREMLADWRGAGKAITGRDNTAEWYLENMGTIKLREETRQWVENELGIREKAETQRTREFHGKMDALGVPR